MIDIYTFFRKGGLLLNFRKFLTLAQISQKRYQKLSIAEDVQDSDFAPFLGDLSQVKKTL